MTKKKAYTGGENCGAEGLSDSAKIAILKRLLRSRYSWPIMLIMMVAVIEPEITRRVYMKFSN